MGFLDNLSKSITQGVDRAKFEAEKLQKTMRIQNDLSEIKKQLDAKRLEFGDRAIELYRAGQIQSPTLGELLKAMEGLQANLTVKEEELKVAQAEAFVEPTTAASPPAQHVPVSSEPSAPPSTPQVEVKPCPNCQFQMPASAIFCPNCGARVGG